MHIKNLAITGMSLCVSLLLLLSAQAHSQGFEGTLFPEGCYENPMYTSSSPQPPFIRSDVCTLFSGNVGPDTPLNWDNETQKIPPNTPNNGTFYLLQSAVGAPTGALVRFTEFFVDGVNGNDSNSGLDWAYPKKTIQAGIDIAANGGVVRVRAGTYAGTGNKNLSFHGKNITIQSESGPESTIINCENDGRGFIFNNGDAGSTVVDGFTIRNGNADTTSEKVGGGIYCKQSSPVIRNCILMNNAGGGFYAQEGSPRIENCIFLGNRASYGGGIQLSNCSKPVIVNNTFIANTSDNDGGGIYLTNTDSPVIANCLLWDNDATKEGDHIFNSGSTLTLKHSDIQGGISGTNTIVNANGGITIDGGGNVNVEPRFVDPGNGNYHLAGDSPCINAGIDAEAPEDDIEREERPEGIHVDIGADEFHGAYINSDIGANDTLPDYWEYYWFGSLTPGDSDDPDVDGIANIDEYHDGTNPKGNPLVYVDGTSGDDANHGYDATHAKKTIQAAINVAYNGDLVLVKDGIYTGAGNKNLNFFGKNLTVRSENGPEKTIIDCENDGRGFVFEGGETASSLVEGFTIRNGNATEGAGVYCRNASPTFFNCNIVGNTGGGIYCENASPRITNCAIVGNSAERGAGIHCLNDSAPSVTGCILSGNTATGWNGGGILLDGGESGSFNPSAQITNCLITHNDSIDSGGGIHCRHASPAITNCTLVGNDSAKGGGISWDSDSDSVVTNCILWDNTASVSGSQITVSNSKPAVKNSDVQGGIGGITGLIDGGGNIAEDPAFIAPENDDYRLDEWVSPCVDTGRIIERLYSDIRGSLRPINNEFDMGAFEHSGFYGGMNDVTTKAFEEVTTDAASGYSLGTGYEYNIQWKNKDPFPTGDARVAQAGNYTVRLALVSTYGKRIDLKTVRVPSQMPPDGYSTPYTFTLEEVGQWYLRVEMADDPNQFALSDNQIKIEKSATMIQSIGKEIVPLSGNVDATQEPEISIGEDIVYWSTGFKKLYAIAPGKARIIWSDTEGRPLVQEVENVWPSDPQIHVANSAPVELLPSDSAYTSVEKKFSNTDASLVSNRFTATNPGYTVLLYRTADGAETFEVVKTVLWDNTDNPAYPVEAEGVIGSKLTDAGHESACGSGYVFTLGKESFYDGDGENKAYDKTTRSGPIIPVNKDDSGNSEDDLVVVWYQKGITNACWPYKPVRYELEWPENPDKIIIASAKGFTLSTSQYIQPSIYYQPDPSVVGYNPNEEHALILDNKVFAIRDDLNVHGGSEPYVLVKYKTSSTGEWAMKVLKVEREGDGYTFAAFDNATAGSPILPPSPLSSFPLQDESYMKSGQDWYHRDHKNGHWTKAASSDNATPSQITMHWYYPLQSGFFYDINEDGTPDAQEGDPIPFLNGGQHIADPPIDVVYTAVWPDEAPILRLGETLTKARNGLPEVYYMAAAQVIFDESVRDGGGPLAKLIDPVGKRSVTLDEIPQDIKTKNIQGYIYFEELPYYLRSRLYWDPINRKLIFKGTLDDSEAGDPLLLLNVMNTFEENRIKELAWGDKSGVIDELSELTRDPNELKLAALVKNPFNSALTHSAEEWESQWGILTGLDNDTAGNPFPQKLIGVRMALTAGAASGEGYLTLAENDDEILGDAPVSLHVIRVAGPPYRGEIKVIEPDNVFDEKLTMRHSGDFGGEPEKMFFEWYYKKPDSSGAAPPLPMGDPGLEGWELYAEGVGMMDITIRGASPFTLSDNWFAVRYNYQNAYPFYPDDGFLSEWAGAPGKDRVAQLYEGWIKRVTNKINLFEQRVSEFHDAEVSTVAGMLMQAGERYEGDVALNDDPENLNQLGLIQAYQTLLNRGRELSIDASLDFSELNNQLMLAASRIVELYRLLGNEAFADATDPTIGFGTEDGQYGSEAPSIFCFQNQLASLLDEELALLRGRNEKGAKPFYNKLLWNFTKGDGEVAYASNYNITDQNDDGFIDEKDARIMYPQGHGDAWGHYLTAIKTYYELLRHPNFTWEPRAESVLVAGFPVLVDYEDERKFAGAAAAKSLAGAEIVSLTYQNKYVEDPEGQWQGYKDSSDNRSWGVDEWANRTGQGAYLDWVVGNAMLPPEDAVHEGIQKVDRTTVVELREIIGHFSEIQSVMDEADIGLNPLGLAKDAVPFDISPTDIDSGKTHFEQIYERAVQSLNNAIVVFNHANQNTNMLRRQQDTLADFQRNVDDREADFNNRLIEIFGYPYPEDCGPSGAYPLDYCDSGPDLYHFDYVDVSELMGIKPPAVQEFKMTVADPVVDADTGAFTTKNSKEITFHLSAEGLGQIKPPSWTDRRKAPGEIQMARSDLLQTKARFEKALLEYDNLIAQIEDQADLLKAQYNLNADEIRILTETMDKQKSLNEEIADSRFRQLVFRTVSKRISFIATALAEANPKMQGIIAGMATGFIFDSTSVVRSAILYAAALSSDILNMLADQETLVELDHQQAKEIVQSQSNIDVTSLRGEFAIKQQLLQIENLIRSEASLRLEIYTLQENLQQTAGRYLAALARGQRLLEDRLRFRVQTADQIQSYRYKDMAFRIFRNDALQKYRAQFDMAAKYVYLAAKAYDFETTLLDSDGRAGQAFLTNIVKQRNIGLIEGGQPITGTGLADPMAKLWQNFQVIKPQLGFNNPQQETNRFSLRRELFRIQDGESSNGAWQDVLEQYRVENLWDVSEFRRYCRPFASEGVSQPGIVIPFSTNVTSGSNFFGWPLGGRDSYYSPTNFATKVRSVGMWFSNYNNIGMAETPRVYLIPVGEDILRTPSGDGLEVRTWQVLDQKLPIPFPVDSSGLADTPEWIPSVDTLSEELFDIRRHSDFRAYHDSGTLNESEMTHDSRLIGRSVWNTRWLLIIPGASLYNDPNEGIERFIHGTLASGGNGERTGNGVSDIKIFFYTYAYSGN